MLAHLSLRHSLLTGLFLGFEIVSAAIVQFDVNDYAGPSPTEPGWTSVRGSADNADTITGTDGVRTLTITTPGDGQDRNRTSGLPSANTSLWRDFWFVSNSTIGGAQTVATISGLAPNTAYAVEIWGFDQSSSGTRSVIWTDAVTGKTGTSSFNGATSSAPASLADYVATVAARSDPSGIVTLTGAAAAGGGTGTPNIFVNGLRVSDRANENPLLVIEAESGTLGADFTVGTLAGATGISSSTTGGGSTPGSAARVATYAVNFPAPDVYQLYVRLHVGAGTYNDDSFFYAPSFGSKSPTTASDWITINSGLVETGFTAADESVTVGGGSAGTQVWKWVRFGTYYTVNSGALSQTFQLGAREDGLTVDKIAFAPADAIPTTANLDAGVLPPRPATDIFEGRDGSALHRFDEPYKTTNYEGAHPASGLVLYNGSLWGAAWGGGLQGRGTLFTLSPDGSSFETAHTLGIAGPSHPAGTLVESGGVFFGASQTGGSAGVGTIFRRDANGALSILRNFPALSPHTATNVGGASPSGPLTLSGGRLFGVASAGGSAGQGVLFSVATDGSGFAVLHEFSAPAPSTGLNADGARPCGALVISGGKLFGVTQEGGAGGTGVVFSCDLSGANFGVTHPFAPLDSATAANTGGAFPVGGLVLANGMLHGTTLGGGAGGQGVLFSLGFGGSGFAVLHDFSPLDPATRTNADGARPVSRLTASGNLLYGVAPAGGASGSGTVFALDVTAPVLRPLHHFEALGADALNARGAHPVGELLRVGNTLFGTAFSGGPGGIGVVFAIPLPMKADLRSLRAASGGIDLIFSGLGAPFSSYTVQAADTLANPTEWRSVRVANADASGMIEHVEAGFVGPRRFFRLVENP